MPDEELELELLDVGKIQQDIADLSLAITEGKADRISDFFRDLLIRLYTNERKLDEYKRFIPIIYHQVNNSTDAAADGEFHINLGPYTTSTQALLLMIPKETSIATESGSATNKLMLYKGSTLNKSFDIYKESNAGSLIKATNGDIVPGRSVLFRLVYSQLSTPKAIIVNTSGLYSANVSNLFVSGEVVFTHKPKVFNPLSTEQEEELVTTSELNDLDTKINGVRDTIVITTADAAEVAADAPAGTIVVQVEDD